MVKSACKPYFVVTKLEVILILVFGVFGMVDIRARLKAIIEAKQHGTEINNAE
jgi:putative membrane protein